MSVVSIHPKRVMGLWKSGCALDLHTTDSTPSGENEFGHMQFKSTYTPIGELLHQLKYRGDMSVASDIIETAVDFLRPHCHKFDLIVPVPPSTERKVQPVILLANGIGRALGIPVADSIRTTRSTAPLKDVTDPGDRKKLLDRLYSVEAAQTRGRNVLLFDDLFRSGSTMNAITEVLLSEGGAVTVRVLTITKTRSKK